MNQQYKFTTHTEKLLADLHTPVGIYLQIRDKFPGSLLLESTDFHTKENSWSFIAIQPIAGVEILDSNHLDFKFPSQPSQQKKIETNNIINELDNFKNAFVPQNNCEVPCVQGFFGYTTFDIVGHTFKINLKNKLDESLTHIALLRYRLYQYVIAINHFNDTLFLCENKIDGIDSDVEKIKTHLLNKQFVDYPFQLNGNEQSNLTDEEFVHNVATGKKHCQRGDVFQIVLSRRFQQKFIGDEFNIYRHLRNINPSPYLFYFDYIDYKIFGSSPESQLIVNKNKMTIHPIAGTIKRTGNDEKDLQNAQQLNNDKKENAEHMMLVDLARNDLSIYAKNVKVNYLKQIKFYSHVIHLVSEVEGILAEKISPFELLFSTFPAGTLSGAPKKKAIELIDKIETTSRSFYGGAIGFIGLNNDVNHAIIIRSFLSKNNHLFYQAGAGIVIGSVEEFEKKEVINKLGALKNAIHFAQTL